MSFFCYWHAEKYTYVLSFENKSYLKKVGGGDQAEIIADL
jgi:hypothetical protein